ncbi:MAG: hypothetical protein GQ533_05060 [Methanosarcinaceae archaeon]|nr:hypothetical protein [Methanosarcinaceae archaeon]
MWMPGAWLIRFLPVGVLRFERVWRWFNCGDCGIMIGVVGQLKSHRGGGVGVVRRHNGPDEQDVTNRHSNPVYPVNPV